MRRQAPLSPTTASLAMIVLVTAAILPLHASKAATKPTDTGMPSTVAATPQDRDLRAELALARPSVAHPQTGLRPGAPPLVAPAGTFRWDPWADFQRSPNQQNPSPDQYGNPDVWSYLAGPSLDHDPGTYVPMPSYEVVDAVYEKWTYPHDMYLLIAHLEDPDELQLHTGAGWLTVLAWRSPINGTIQVNGTLRLRGGECANVATGVLFSIDKGAHTLSRVVLNEPGTENIGAMTKVAQGESLYFILDPGRETNCDTTLLTLSITGQGTMPDTAMSQG